MTDSPAAGRVAKLTDIWKSYGAVPVLKGVSLALQAGEVHALLGGNGAGKSSLMKIMSGVIPANSGAIEINGRALAHASPAHAQDLGLYLVPQEAHILPNQSVLENICLGLAASPKALRPRVEQLVAELSVSLDLDAQAAALEIAERQIVEVLRGLVRDARVLILDEPTDGLDPNQKHQVRKLIQSLAKDKIVIISTHILEEVSAVCTRAVVIAAGKVVADGTPLELESRSRYHQAVTLVAEGELDRAALAALPGVAGVEDNAEGSLTLLAAPGQVIFPQVNELIRQRGWQVKELDVERGRLDEVFRSLTRGEAA